MNVFSQRLRELRGNKTQAEVAQEIGLTSSAYSMYEGGRREPNFDTLVMIADHFGVSTDYLLGRTECKSPDIDIQAASERFGLSEATLKRLETTNDNNNVDGLCVSNLYFNKLIDFLIINMSWMDVEGWYEALVTIQSHRRTNKISLYASAKDRIGDDNSVAISLEDARVLYAQLIAHHVLSILLGDKDTNCVLSQIEKILNNGDHKR